MQGTILIYRPGASEPEVRSFAHALDLGDLKDAIGGGWLELVPGFDSINHAGKMHRCIVLCDEEAKLDYRTSGKATIEPDPANQTATALWDSALRRTGHPGLLTPGGGLADYLSGQIAIVIGDDEFMETL